MEVDYKAIGQRIKIARIKKGVTQETVADLIDITPAHMSNVETGKTKCSGYCHHTHTSSLDISTLHS